MINRLTRSFRTLKKRQRTNIKKMTAYVQKRRRLLLAAVVALFAVAFIASRFWQKPIEVEEAVVVTPLEVSATIFGQGESTFTTTATIENQTTLTLVAQSAGPVATIQLDAGDSVRRGQTILNQSTTYAGGNAPAVQAQIAAENAQLAARTVELTEESVAQARRQADLNQSNSDELRQISEQSIQETKDLIALSETQVAQLEDELATAPPNLQPTIRGSLIASLNGLTAARAQLRNLEYTTNTDNPPTQLNDILRDSIYTSTEIQLTTARSQKRIAALSLQAANIAASATRVQAPINGRIETMLVKPGQFVQPGTPVAVVSGQPELKARVKVSSELAARLHPNQHVLLQTEDGQLINVYADHVSTAPVSSTLFEVIVTLPETIATTGRWYDGQTVTAILPLTPTLSQPTTIPVDAVFVSSSQRIVFVDNQGIAEAREVTTGRILDAHIEIIDGLTVGDIVITDRRVVEGQPVDSQLSAVVIEQRG